MLGPGCLCPSVIPVTGTCSRAWKENCHLMAVLWLFLSLILTYPYWFFSLFFSRFSTYHHHPISEKKYSFLKMSFQLCKLECICSEKASEIWGSGFQKRERGTPVLFLLLQRVLFLEFENVILYRNSASWLKSYSFLSD